MEHQLKELQAQSVAQQRLTTRTLKQVGVFFFIRGVGVAYARSPESRGATECVPSVWRTNPRRWPSAGVPTWLRCARRRLNWMRAM
jgi:hypothetical protein